MRNSPLLLAGVSYPAINISFTVYRAGITCNQTITIDIDGIIAPGINQWMTASPD